MVIVGLRSFFDSSTTVPGPGSEAGYPNRSACSQDALVVLHPRCGMPKVQESWFQSDCRLLRSGCLAEPSVLDGFGGLVNCGSGPESQNKTDLELVSGPSSKWGLKGSFIGAGLGVGDKVSWLTLAAFIAAR